MNIKKTIKSKLIKISKANLSECEDSKKRILRSLEDNLLNKKQSVKDNIGLIERYNNTKPKQLTQMQQAMQEAVS